MMHSPVSWVIAMLAPQAVHKQLPGSHEEAVAEG